MSTKSTLPVPVCKLAVSEIMISTDPEIFAGCLFAKASSITAKLSANLPVMSAGDAADFASPGLGRFVQVGLVDLKEFVAATQDENIAVYIVAAMLDIWPRLRPPSFVLSPSSKSRVARSIPLIFAAVAGSNHTRRGSSSSRKALDEERERISLPSGARELRSSASISLDLATTAITGFRSTPMHRKPSSAAACVVVPEPFQGSRTTDWGRSLLDARTFCANSSGNPA